MLVAGSEDLERTRRTQVCDFTLPHPTDHVYVTWIFPASTPTQRLLTRPNLQDSEDSAAIIPIPILEPVVVAYLVVVVAAATQLAALEVRPTTLHYNPSALTWSRRSLGTIFNLLSDDVHRALSRYHRSLFHPPAGHRWDLAFRCSAMFSCWMIHFAWAFCFGSCDYDTNKVPLIRIWWQCYHEHDQRIRRLR